MLQTDRESMKIAADLISGASQTNKRARFNERRIFVCVGIKLRLHQTLFYLELLFVYLTYLMIFFCNPGYLNVATLIRQPFAGNACARIHRHCLCGTKRQNRSLIVTFNRANIALLEEKYIESWLLWSSRYILTSVRLMVLPPCVVVYLLWYVKDQTYSL